MNYTVIFIGVIVILAFLGLWVIPRLMLKRAMKKVLKAFRTQNATNFNNAKTLEELGLKPKSFLEGMFHTRDYRPYALDMLRRIEVIQTTEDGKLYLLEPKLQEKLGHSWIYKG